MWRLTKVARNKFVLDVVGDKPKRKRMSLLTLLFVLLFIGVIVKPVIIEILMLTNEFVNQ